MSVTSFDSLRLHFVDKQPGGRQMCRRGTEEKDVCIVTACECVREKEKDQ